MTKALAEEKSPLDACLETVLPGVHQWHHANQAAVSALRDDTRTLHCDMNVGFSHVIAELQETRRQRTQQQAEFANLLEMGRRVLLTGTTLEPMSTIETSVDSVIGGSPLIDVTDAAVTESLDQGLAELELHKTYTMRPKHKLLTELMSELTGCGDFHDQFGGIEGRNKKYGPKWRKHLPKYTYSRTERTIKGIRGYAKQHNITDMDACRQLQEVYQQQKCAVKNMVDYFTNELRVLSKRKPRGKVKNIPDSVSPSTPTEQ
jgi:Transcriptional activator of glycolytic enzymes